MPLPNIRTRIRSLHNHLLPTNRPARESELIALTARRIGSRHSREAVGEIIGHGPG